MAGAKFFGPMRKWSLLLAAVAALAAAGPAAAESPHVAGLQVALRAYGYYGGSVDGVRGPGTEAAIRAFQAKHRLPVDGIAGAMTRRALGKLGRPLFGRRPLTRGRIGLDVSALQFLLARNGLGTVADGYFCDRTEAAVRRFQSRAGLTVDGIAGPATLAALRSSVPASAPVAPRRYVVRPGDSLTAIAVRHGTSIDALARLNRLDPARPLLIGTRLTLPTRSSSSSSPPLSPPPSTVRVAIDATARRYGVDPSLARALAWMESGFQQHVVSSAGALGVMQVTPATWDFVEDVVLGRVVPHTADGNILVGVLFLRHLLREFGGDERLALGAYYQGARAVRERGLLAETVAYVDAIRSLKGRV
ncbi:MAG: peptidoglycan-binding protein [Actinobacteria bacterium]|nr:peptidoglycan-binding protein [Actinomycetota bacterium]